MQYNVIHIFYCIAYIEFFQYIVLIICYCDRKGISRYRRQKTLSLVVILNERSECENLFQQILLRCCAPQDDDIASPATLHVLVILSPTSL